MVHVDDEDKIKTMLPHSQNGNVLKINETVILKSVHFSNFCGLIYSRGTNKQYSKSINFWKENGEKAIDSTVEFEYNNSGGLG